VRREITQRLFVVLRGTLGSYLRDAVQEGGAAGVAFLPGPKGSGLCAFFLFFFADGFH
jgi:hypothetical protein